MQSVVEVEEVPIQLTDQMEQEILVGLEEVGED
jgi:hypothetical protein